MILAMKNLFKSLMIVAAATMTFSACNKVETENPQNEENFYYTFALTSPDTRSVLNTDDNGKFGAWENGDRLGTAVDNGSLGYSRVELGDPITFSIYKSGGLKEGETVYAYYPYNNSAKTVSSVPMTIPDNQNQPGGFDYDAMPMVAEGFVVPAELESDTNNTPVGVINLLNLGSVIDFQIFSTNATYAEETIMNVKFEASSAISGDFTKDITAVKANDESTLTISGFTGTEVTTTVGTAASTIGSSRNRAAHIYMVVAPVSGITGSVIVTTNKAVYTYSMSTAQTFKRAGLKSFGLDLGTCQNRVANEGNTTTFVFNTTAGIEALGLELPSTGSGANVVRVVSDCIVLEGNVAEGSTQPRVWNNNGTYNFRVNKKNTITFSVSEGTIKGISFEAGSNFNLTYSDEDGTLTGTSWEGSASSVTFTNTDANRTDINTITVSYVGGVAPIEPIKLEMSDITCDDSEENENSLTFSWTAVDNADGYQVSIDGGNTYGDVQSELTYNWTGLAAGRQYTIYVKAVGDGTNYLTSEAKSQTGKTKAAQGGGTPTDYIEGFAMTIGATTTYSSSTWTHNASGTSWSATYSSTEIATLSTNSLNLAIGKTPGNVSFSGDKGITKLSFDYKSQGNATSMKITIKSGDNTVYEKESTLSKNSTGSVSLTASDFSTACEGAFSVTIANTSDKNSLQISAVNWTSAK